MTRGDFMGPRDRVPREPSAAPSLWALIAGVCFLNLLLWALPDLAAWISSWRIGP